MIDYSSQNKIAAKWLLEYPERKHQYINIMSEFTLLSAVSFTGMPTGTDVGMPTQRKAVLLAGMEENKLWLMSVEDTESILSEKKLAFLDIRRKAELIKYEGIPKAGGRPSWLVYTQTRYSDWHQRRYGYYYEPSRKTIFNWWDEIINIAVRIAIKRGCL